LKPESRRQKKIRQLLQREVGGYWRKIWGGPYQRRGLPDIIGCCEGLFFGFEVKEPNGMPSELQKIEVNEIYEAGGCSAIIIEPEEAVRLVRQTIARAKRMRGLHNKSG